MSIENPVLYGNRLYSVPLYSENPDVQTINVNLSDSTSPSDSRIIDQITQVLIDTLTSTDSTAKSVTKPLSDSQTSSDSIVKDVTKPFNDSTTLIDSQLIANIIQELSDSLSSSDAKAFTVTKPLADSLSSLDSFTKTVNKILNDSQSSTDSYAIMATKALLESMTLADTMALLDAIKPFTDTLTLSDSIAKTSALALTDSQASSDVAPLTVIKPFPPAPPSFSPMTLYGPSLYSRPLYSDLPSTPPNTETIYLLTIISFLIRKVLAETLTLTDVIMLITLRIFLETVFLSDSRALTGIKGLTDFFILNDWLSIHLQKADPWTSQSASIEEPATLILYGSLLYGKPIYSGLSTVAWNTTPSSKEAFTNADGTGNVP